MTTTWKSGEKKPNNQSTNNTISGTTLSSWSQQQKLAMIAGFAMLGLSLVVCACSKQSAKPALVSVSSPAPAPGVPAVAPTPVASTIADAQTSLLKPVKKTPKKRPADVTYSDSNSGLSFLYPRKFSVISGDTAQAEFAAVGDVPMNFVQPGGIAIATVALPANAYPGTDFASGFFNVSVNRAISQQECSHFAFVDTRNADGEPVDAEKVKIGGNDMEMTSDFTASAIKQVETQYYHNYANGFCYEYSLGLSTEGFTTEGNILHVNRDEVFAKLEKILATVKVNPVETEPVAEVVDPIAASTGAAPNSTSGKK
jgi:hypothetical protein